MWWLIQVTKENQILELRVSPCCRTFLHRFCLSEQKFHLWNIYFVKLCRIHKKVCFCKNICQSKKIMVFAEILNSWMHLFKTSNDCLPSIASIRFVNTLLIPLHGKIWYNVVTIKTIHLHLFHWLSLHGGLHISNSVRRRRNGYNTWGDGIAADDFWHFQPFLVTKKIAAAASPCEWISSVHTPR